jgi:hypothetical protein
VIGRRQTSLLFAGLLLGACASERPSKPPIPASVSPGWKLASLEKAALPVGVPANGAPECWKANYSGAGAVNVWICWYRESGSAFDAVQRTVAQAQTVKFQEGQYFVLLRWNNTDKASLTALIRAIEKALQPPK